MDWLLADLLELPKDLVLDLPRITLIGQHELVLENHRGVMSYRTDQVRVNLARGYLELDGEELIIKYITRDELGVAGLIKSIRFCG